MKPIYKATKVVYNAHLEQYEVYYKTFLFWKYECCYRFDTDRRFITHYCNKEEAEKRAIERAEGMLNSVEVWKKSRIL